MSGALAHATAPAVEVVRQGSARRVMECAFAGSVLVVLAPVLLAIALLVAISSPGPVLFRQVRAGRGGVPFVLFKFRTMYADAEQRADEVFAVRDDGSGPLSKLRDDPRVTTLGRWLRRLSLDELPQLWNVLNGSMGLVGPRPTALREVARFGPDDHRRHAVRPGITGLPQVSGRSDLDWEQAVALDLYYIEHRSLWLDIWILLRTIPAVLRAQGAY